MNEIVGLGAGDLIRLMKRRELSALEVVRAYLSRVEEIDGAIHAILRINPRVEEEAQEADRRLTSSSGGDLNGIPVVVKDNLATEGLSTTCASRILEDFVPLHDATAVALLRAAGAVILGKTNMDEFAMGSSTESSAYGPTRNPWDLDRVPGGSSGGSAAALAADMAPLALGSDTGGSVRQPAAFCGVVGLKPTYGRISRSGLVAFGSSLDQVGPMAGNVRDCALLLKAIAGNDPGDATSIPMPVDDYPEACEKGVEGLRVGIPLEYLEEGVDEEIRDAVLHAARALEIAGARVEEVSLPHVRYAIPTYYLVSSAEASSNLARFDGVRYGRRVDTDDGLEAMYRSTRGQGLGAEVKRRIMLGTYVLSAGYYEAFYAKALRVRTLLRGDYLQLFESGMDLLLGPTTPSPAFEIGEKVNDPLAMYLTDIYTASVNLAGIPAISVPVGLTGSGLPAGAQITGPDFSETTIFRAAAAVETTLGPLTPPAGSS